MRRFAFSDSKHEALYTIVRILYQAEFLDDQKNVCFNFSQDLTFCLNSLVARYFRLFKNVVHCVNFHCCAFSIPEGISRSRLPCSLTPRTPSPGAWTYAAGGHAAAAPPRYSRCIRVHSAGNKSLTICTLLQIRENFIIGQTVVISYSRI